MKVFGIIINLLLSVVYLWLRMGGNWQWNFEVISLPVALFALLTFVHIRVCNTPTSAREKYESWRRLLPSASDIKINKNISFGVIVFTYVILFTFHFLLSGNAWWHTVLYVTFVLVVPLMSLKFLAKGGTLNNAKDYFPMIVEALKDPKYQSLNLDTTLITPDTPFSGVILKKSGDYWQMVNLCSDMMIKFQLPMYDDDDKINKAWEDFIKRANKLKPDSPKQDKIAIVQEGIEIGKAFCLRHNTVGGMAIWISEMLEMGQIQGIINNAS